MPTKRRFMLFLLVLAVMLLIKYAVGQEEVGWDPVSVYPADDITLDAVGACLMGVVFGILSGFWRVAAQRRSDLVVLRIRA
jgi:hypothetical protein